MFETSTPIYLQLIEIIKKDLAQGRLLPGDKLPSSRDFAVKYSVNPNTATRVFKEMENLGLCTIKRGIGTFVVERKNIVEEIKKQMATKYAQDYIANATSIGLSKLEIIEFFEKGLDYEVDRNEKLK